MTALAAYRIRLGKVLAYIESHLEEELSLEHLSAVAGFSKYHFHRQFSQLFGISVSQYVKLVRLHRASYQLVVHAPRSVLEIALTSGYESHEAFSRAFKRTFGQTPSAFREQPDWDGWSATDQRVRQLRSEHMDAEYRLEDVKVVSFPETPVAAVEHRGDPRRLLDSVRKLVAWRKQHGLSPKVSATFNILHNDPAETPPEAYRMDLCAATSRPVDDNDLGVVQKSIPAGRCAVLRQVGSSDLLAHTVRYLYGSWLPQSGEELRDFPLFVQRVRFAPEVPESETVLDLFLPLR